MNFRHFALIQKIWIANNFYKWKWRIYDFPILNDFTHIRSKRIFYFKKNVGIFSHSEKKKAF